MLVAMIESEQGVHNAREIVETPGVSAIQTVHIPDADATRILQMCLDRRVVAATDATPEDMKAKLDAGYRMLSVGWDFDLLRRELADTIKGMRSAVK